MPGIKMHSFREAMNGIFLFSLVVVGALLTDGILHLADKPDWGRNLGYWGTGLIAVSFLYSARKRKLITLGKAQYYLKTHEFLTWLGALLILVHAGIHFNGLLPWLAVAAMLVAVASGLTGKFLLKKSKLIIAERKKALKDEGLAPEHIEEQLYWESIAAKLMTQWRKVHFPITMCFAFLTLLHITSVMIFWRW